PWKPVDGICLGDRLKQEINLILALCPRLYKFYRADKMAVRNNLVTNLWQRVQQDSVSWGSLVLWICGLVVLLTMLGMFANA
ncbi:hypothetical protein, partial [Tolypothrix sp. VBCCA 56010]|uniref:hypothetical protein n=1 Tax=Tolypothrix sp. VBCCA 56010 TaxID=3137731 RepID=UPI003D7D1709